jgi:hypothetical protein
MLWLKFDRIVLKSYLPVAVPVEKRPAIAEYITRANYGLMTGSFEMDYNDGEVIYRTSLDFKNDQLTSALIDNLAKANLAIFDRYYPGLMEIIYGNAEPETTVKKIEGK